MLWCSEGSDELFEVSVLRKARVDVPTREVGVPVLSEALQRKEKCFYFASGAASGCFNCCFVLEEEIFWVGVPIVLWENGGVETWWPRELFEFHGEGRGEVLLWMKLLRMKVMWHHVLAFLLIRELFSFDENRLLAKPLRLRRLLHGSVVLTKGLHHNQTISNGLLHCLAAKFLFL